jgi:signal transduction histidine kinase/AraC-like DNA-binding protein/ABC-type sugar transport system substrate-binding protein
MTLRTPNGRFTIGVLTGWQYYWTETSRSYLDLLYRGIRTAAHDYDCNLLLACGMGPSATSDDPAHPAWPISAPDVDFVPIGPWNTDGLIVLNPLLVEACSHYIQNLIARQFPIIFVGTGQKGLTIAADNETGMLEALHHLIEHGHRQIAYIAGGPEDTEGDSGERLNAFQRVVQTYGLESDARLIDFGLHTAEGGHQAMRRILSSGVPFTAVLASNDESAFGAMRALTEAQRNIPQDVALIGFDDRPEAAVQEPALSSVHIPLFKMGYRALELLLQEIQGQPSPDMRHNMPVRLVPRESCGCGKREVLSHSANPSVPASSAEQAARRFQIEQDIVESVLSETLRFSPEMIRTMCQRLIAAFTTAVEQHDFEILQQAVLSALEQTKAISEGMHIWQTAISILRDEVEVFWPLPAPAAVQLWARDVLDRAHLIISEATWQQYQRYVVKQGRMLDRVGRLTAQLLHALNETQIFEVLAHHLPAMGIRRAALAFFEAAGEDAVAWSNLRMVPHVDEAPVRFPSREFPPGPLQSREEVLSLVLIPMISQHGPSGYVAFDADQLDLQGAIVQQLTAALNNVQLYHEAVEGRRLAEEANQLKSRFLSTVSHELRTPLNLIGGLSEILLKESDEGVAHLPDRYRIDVERIHASAQHLGWLISDVLDLASSEAGQLRLTSELVDLSETLRMVSELGQQLAKDKSLRWYDSLPEPGPRVWGDRTRLRQIALNLVANAVKFTMRGEVRLTLNVDDDVATVSVSDTGLGISPDEQQLIFNEFRRSERSASRGYGGLGLGLAICKRLVELHGGSLGVRSSGEEDAGSMFYFTLPVVPAPIVSAPLPALPMVERSVMLLTNRPSGSERLREHLTQRGYEVHLLWLDESPDWLALLTAAQPSLIVLDVGLVPSQGWEVLKALKSRSDLAHTPVLFCSLMQEGGAILELDYLLKPIGIADLTQALDQQWLIGEGQQAGKTILIVDDDAHTVEMHARMVQSHSSAHRILKARHGREALELLQREHADLILLDLMMPELDGFGVLDALRTDPAMRDIPVIVVTGQVLTENDMAQLNRGVATVLGKGLFSVDETLAHIDAALAQKRKLKIEAQQLVRQAMAYLHEHYAQPITREDVARHVNMNEDYLTFCFRKELGMTPIAYLNRYRINQAKQLLATRSLSITEVALEVGFYDHSYFSRVFRREVGLSPDAYRRAEKTG